MFTKKDQLESLAQFRSILKQEGVLIVDERNYQHILDNKKEILKGNFQYSGKYVYCGKKVQSIPIQITNNLVKWKVFSKQTGIQGHVSVYPFKRGEIKNLLLKSGFKSINQYSDYKPGENIDAEFYQYVCIK